MWIANNGSRATATVIAAALRDIGQMGLAEEIEDIAEEGTTCIEEYFNHVVIYSRKARRAKTINSRRKHVVPTLKQLTVKRKVTVLACSADEPVIATG